MINYLN